MTSWFLQKELENFPVGTIQHCQAVNGACSFDSILALICKESGQNKPDLHLFQCDHVKVTLRFDWPPAIPRRRFHPQCPVSSSRPT